MDKDIIAFLIRAKRATYAGKGAESTPSRPGSHDFDYQEANLRYIDSYLGGNKFAGEEALWNGDECFWAMNYCGRVLSDAFEGDFLKEALLNIPAEMPFRGPNNYTNGSFKYVCVVDGDFSWFNGTEEIYKDKTKVYECVFHGGVMAR